VTKVEWSLADGYRLMGFSHHDGTIREFRYGLVAGNGSQRRDLVLDVDNLQDETIRLHFAGVEILRVTELWEGSIIYDFHLAKLSDPVVMQEKFERFWESLQYNEAGVRSLVNKFSSHLAVVLFGSYGCALSLLCEYLNVSKTPRFI
jgi:hypothetical protein